MWMSDQWRKNAGGTGPEEGAGDDDETAEAAELDVTALLEEGAPEYALEAVETPPLEAMAAADVPDVPAVVP
jgi:hypothetical protein